MNIYPQNFKEAVVSAIPNCTTMVIGMVTFNLWIYGYLTWGNFFVAFLEIYLVAFCLDFFIVGPCVMRLVNRLSVQKYTPLFRVGMMACILTGVAPVLEAGVVPEMRQYFAALPRNYIAALFLQVFVVFKLGSWCLKKYRVKTTKSMSKN